MDEEYENANYDSSIRKLFSDSYRKALVDTKHKKKATNKQKISAIDKKRKSLYVRYGNHNIKKSPCTIKYLIKPPKIAKNSPSKYSSKINESENDTNKCGNLEEINLPQEGSEYFFKQKPGVLFFGPRKNSSSVKSKRHSGPSENFISEALELDASGEDDVELSLVSRNKHTYIVNSPSKSTYIQSLADTTQKSNPDESLPVKENSGLISKREKSGSSNLEEGNFESDITIKKKLARGGVGTSSSGSESDTSIHSFKEKEAKRKKTRSGCKNKRAYPLTASSACRNVCAGAGDSTYPEKRKVPQKSVVGDNCRRSCRQRHAPFPRWRNERPLYVCMKYGEIEFVGVDKGTEEDDGAARALFKKLNKVKKDLKKPKKAKLIDINTNKKIAGDIVKRFLLIPWNEPIDKSVKAPYMIKNMFATENYSFGFLQIEKDKEKPVQYIPEQDLHLTLIRGAVEITIQKNSYVISEKDMAVVPAGSAYSIKNVGNMRAVLSYVTGIF